jgi:catechol 1,2-dioxygenase
VFAVKDDLVVDFKPRNGDPKAELDLEYNVILAPKSFEGVTSLSQTTIGLGPRA